VAQRKEERLAQRIEQRVIRATMQFSGPLPPPELLAKYNDAVPNGAQRIVEMAEKQQTHRIGIEKRVVHWNTLDQRLGLILGFILAVSIAGGGFWLINKGKDAMGIAAVIAAIASPTGAFIWSKNKQDQQRKDNANTFPSAAN
jgi:uncharacterized membrane protein